MKAKLFSFNQKKKGALFRFYDVSHQFVSPELAQSDLE